MDHVSSIAALPPLRLASSSSTSSCRAATLYRHLGPAVYRRCVNLLRNEEAARDATQEVFVRLVRHEDRLAEHDDLLPWLLRVATNLCLNQLRDVRSHAEDALAPDEEARLPERTVPDRTDAMVVRRVLACFDDDTRSIAVGVLVDEMDQDEVAQRLGISRRTVARRLQRFLDRARRLVDVEEAAPRAA